ncbi:MAG: VOC family protein [Pseudomonadota bacterium]
MNKPEPRAVVPIIAVESVDETRRFYLDNLGFDHVRGLVGKDGQLDFCTVARDGARIMFARAPEGSPGAATARTRQPVGIYLEIADVERYFGQLREKKGVKVTEPLTMQWWGDRTFKVLDPNGYELWFYQTVGTPRPPQGLKII